MSGHTVSTRAWVLLPLIWVIGTLAPVAQAGAQTSDVLDTEVDQWVVVRDGERRGDDPRLTLDEGGLGVLTGASAIMFSPDAVASGSYRVELDVTQFDPGGRNEGFGLIFGGTDLNGPDQAYGYFLIRQDGQALLKRRAGERTFIVHDWTPVPALQQWATRASGADRIVNRIVMEVEDNDVRLQVNGQPILRDLDVDLETAGVVGLRVNHGLRIQVERFEITSLR